METANRIVRLAQLDPLLDKLYDEQLVELVNTRCFCLLSVWSNNTISVAGIKATGSWTVFPRGAIGDRWRSDTVFTFATEDDRQNFEEIKAALAHGPVTVTIDDDELVDFIKRRFDAHTQGRDDTFIDYVFSDLALIAFLRENLTRRGLPDTRFTRYVMSRPRTQTQRAMWHFVKYSRPMRGDRTIRKWAAIVRDMLDIVVEEARVKGFGVVRIGLPEEIHYRLGYVYEDDFVRISHPQCFLDKESVLVIDPSKCNPGK